MWKVPCLLLLWAASLWHSVDVSSHLLPGRIVTAISTVHWTCAVQNFQLQVVYNRNGVRVTATPVSHYNTSGPVAYRLDWQGLSFTYSGDGHSGMPTLKLYFHGTALHSQIGKLTEQPDQLIR